MNIEIVLLFYVPIAAIVFYFSLISLRDSKYVRTLAGPRDALAVTVFLFLWLIPMVYSGVSNDQWFKPRRILNAYYRTAHLFTHDSPAWGTNHIQVMPAGSDFWVTISEDLFFPSEPFGYVNRFNHSMDYFPVAVKGEISKSLALWIREKYGRLYPYQPKIDAVRFLRLMTSSDDANLPVGHWEEPNLSQYESKDLQITFTYDFREAEIGKKV